MRTIYKYALELDEFIQEIGMPAAADVLDIGMQDGIPVIWAMVNTDAPRVVRKFQLFGTGWTIKDDARLDHVSTVRDREFVWHIFEVFTP